MLFYPHATILTKEKMALLETYVADGGKLDNDELAHEEEYNAMQEWRKKAKTVASEVMKIHLSNV